MIRKHLDLHIKPKITKTILLYVWMWAGDNLQVFFFFFGGGGGSVQTQTLIKIINYLKCYLQ